MKAERMKRPALRFILQPSSFILTACPDLSICGLVRLPPGGD